MSREHDCGDSQRPRAVSRRQFLKIAMAAGLLAGCRSAQQPTPSVTLRASATPILGTDGTSAAEEPTSAPPATSVPTDTPVATVEPTEEPITEATPVADLPALLGSLHWLGHASFRLDGPPTIYFDPTSARSDSPQADVILISHGHSDHYSFATLKRISGPETVIVTTPGIAGGLESTDLVYGEVRALQPGEQTMVGDVVIEAVPAYNISKSYHPRSAGYLGFVVTFEGERLYFAGDTDHIPEMADIRCDVALLPIGGTYTMDVEEAAQAAADINPQVVVPMHMRSADPEEFRRLCDCEVVLMEMEF